jgi:phosphoenolpyruvate-protein phosphotransferase
MERSKKQFENAKSPAKSMDGVDFQVLANISSPKEAQLAYNNGAEGIGLYRTEFLFMNRETPPTEEEQYRVYREVCQNMNGLPITIRTIDIGGDKPIPYLGIAEENNPFLGLRGIRYCLHNVPFFKAQLRALCRISADYEIRVMYPMIGVLEEVRRANTILKEVQKDLEKEGIKYSKSMKVGIMVEVPSVIYQIPKLMTEIDFLSVGTNDLTQYLLAKDRENSIVSDYYSALHPAVIAALQKIVIAANESNLDLSLCGEIARNQEAIQLLSAIGFRKFSMSSPAIPEIKTTIRSMNLSGYQYSKNQINDWDTLEEVKSAMKN